MFPTFFHSTKVSFQFPIKIYPNSHLVPCLFSEYKKNVRNLKDIQYNGIRTHNHLVRKRTLNTHLASLTKWLNLNLRTKWLRV